MRRFANKDPVQMKVSTAQFDLKIDRISMTLRRGSVVMIRDAKGQAALIRAAEFCDNLPEGLDDLALIRNFVSDPAPYGIIRPICT